MEWYRERCVTLGAAGPAMTKRTLDTHQLCTKVARRTRTNSRSNQVDADDGTAQQSTLWPSAPAASLLPTDAPSLQQNPLELLSQKSPLPLPPCTCVGQHSQCQNFNDAKATTSGVLDGRAWWPELILGKGARCITEVVMGASRRMAKRVVEEEEMNPLRNKGPLKIWNAHS